MSVLPELTVKKSPEKMQYITTMHIITHRCKSVNPVPMNAVFLSICNTRHHKQYNNASLHHLQALTVGSTEAFQHIISFYRVIICRLMYSSETEQSFIRDKAHLDRDFIVNC